MNQAHVSVPVLNPKTMTYDERKKLAYDTLDYIKAHPERWDQGEWRCSTGMCYAGWLATLAGGTWMDEDFGSYTTSATLALLPGEEPDPRPTGHASMHRLAPVRYWASEYRRPLICSMRTTES